MFNIGDRVRCNSGTSKGKVGVVVRYTTYYAGKPRIVVLFDGDKWETALWTHRFTLETPESKEEILLKKIRQMGERQTWKKSLA